MPKHKKRNAFPVDKIWPVYIILQNKKVYQKNYTRTETWKLVSDPFCVWKEVSTTSIGKTKFLKQATYIRDIIAKLSKFIQIDIQASSGSFYRGLFENQFFDKNFSFAILHKLAEFYYQTVLTSQVIQLNLFGVSCLDIRWRHDIRISEMIKFDYLKNEKSFRSEVKNMFPCFISALLQNKLTQI